MSAQTSTYRLRIGDRRTGNLNSVSVEDLASSALSMRPGRHMFFPDLRRLRCRAGLVEAQQVQSFRPSFLVEGAVFVVGAFDNALALKNGLQFLHIVSGDVEKRFILRCVCHRFPYGWSRGIQRGAGSAGHVGKMHQAIRAPMGKAGIGQRLAGVSVWSSIYHAAAPPYESRIKARRV